MSILEVNHVSIRYMTGDFKDIGLKEYVMRRLKHNYHVQEFWADRDVSFSLDKGDMLGIIGSNGAGKSTLLKVVSGIMEPTEGYVKRKGNIAALLELASGFDRELTVKENAYLRGAMLGYTRKFMDETYDRIIDFAELREFQDRPFKQLSSGMKSRLAFSIASLVQPDILILDEVLSVGDGAFRKKSEKKMREIITGGATTILVSHSLEQVKQLCNKVLWLEKGRQIAFGDTRILCSLYQQYLDKRITVEQAKAMWDSMERHYDWLVVGAGLYGAAFAREMTERGKSCLVIEARTQVGGNARCEQTDTGITVHKYAPHVFHTSDKAIWDYAARFAAFKSCPDDTASEFDRSGGKLTDAYRGIPVGGCGVLAEEMLKGIAVVTGLSYQAFVEAYPDAADRILYTGGIDQFFDYSLGHLAYESLKFKEEELKKEFYQERAVEALPEPEDDFTHTVEHKRISGEQADTTVVTMIGPLEWGPGRAPYYPVKDEKNQKLYQEYLELAKKLPEEIAARLAEKEAALSEAPPEESEDSLRKGKKEKPPVTAEVYFGGRLGEYRYYTMAEAIAAARKRAEELSVIA